VLPGEDTETDTGKRVCLQKNKIWEE